MEFCTAINCMDGRVQIPVIKYLLERFSADYVDVVSEAGPNRIIAENSDMDLVESIERRVEVSVERHHSVGIAIVGHYDCAGNPSAAPEQMRHTAATVLRIQDRFPQVPVIGLWVDQEWQVTELDGASTDNAAPDE